MIINAFDKRVRLTGNVGKNVFKRLPDEVTTKLPHLFDVANNTAGIRLSFYTDATAFTIKAIMGNITFYKHICAIVYKGFDVFINKELYGCEALEEGEENLTYEVSLPLSNELKLIDIYFPLYGDVKEFKIIIDDLAHVSPNKVSRYDKPIVFYGSSITQGACASRNSLSYTNMLSMMLDTTIYNLGFSGKAKGEREIAEYIATLDMAAFILDYDHNTPSVEQLAMTHEPFLKRIREKQPNLPIILASRSDIDDDLIDSDNRRRIIMQTYVEALNQGDKNIYFVDGKEMFKDYNRDMCTVDNTHPNTLGFYRMAITFKKTILQALEDKQ
ncbi:MAG: hypothetical protein KAG94_06560 [Clostridiales bacterium]|nr:hypothetical protein [Clostridiales bacterium]